MTLPQAIRNNVLQSLTDMMPHYGFDKVDPLLILSESQLETGNFASSLVTTTNNCFGMKFPTVRATTATGHTANNYAIYNSVADSVQDYLMRQANFHIPNTADPVAYIAATVASGYAEDPHYPEKWMAVYQDNGGGMSTPLDPVVITPHNTSNLAGVGLLALFGIAAWAATHR